MKHLRASVATKSSNLTDMDKEHSDANEGPRLEMMQPKLIYTSISIFRSNLVIIPPVIMAAVIITTTIYCCCKKRESKDEPRRPTT